MEVLILEWESYSKLYCGSPNLENHENIMGVLFMTYSMGVLFFKYKIGLLILEHIMGVLFMTYTMGVLFFKHNRTPNLGTYHGSFIHDIYYGSPIL